MTDNDSTEMKPKLCYRDSLDPAARAKYVEKIAVIDGKDPYDFSKWDWSLKIKDLPELFYPHVYEYLVDKQKSHTHEDMRSYKSSDSYKFFKNGWVKDLRSMKLDDGHGRCLISGKVRYSQCFFDGPQHSWVLAEKNGDIVTAHCDCLAANCETCSHVVALLFLIDEVVRTREPEPEYDPEDFWKDPVYDHIYGNKTIAEIFGSVKSEMTTSDDELSSYSEPEDTPDSSMPLPKLSPPSEEEKKAFFAALYATGTKPVVLSTIAEYSHLFIPEPLKYPRLLSELHNEKFINMDRMSLIKYCKTLMKDIKVTSEEVKNVEDLTYEKTEIDEQLKYQIGRITDSQMKNVCEASVDDPSQYLVKSICYPDTNQVHVRWQCPHEDDALEWYLQQMQNNHENLVVLPSGFVICKKYPFIGAMPDGTATCDCCGEVNVVIKCLDCRNDFPLVEDMQDENFCLEKYGNHFQLKKSHMYYYQIQSQLYVCDKEFSDVIVLTKADYHVERIELDVDMAEDIMTKSKQFFSQVILPELVGKLYTRPSTVSLLAVNNPSPATHTHNTRRKFKKYKK